MVLMMEGVKQFSVAMSLEGHDAGASSSGNNPNLKYTGDLSSSSVDVATKSFPEVEEYVNGKIGVNGPPNATVTENKGTAKIHDFCFGIPFGQYVWFLGMFVGNPLWLMDHILCLNIHERPTSLFPQIDHYVQIKFGYIECRIYLPIRCNMDKSEIWRRLVVVKLLGITLNLELLQSHVIGHSSSSESASEH